MGTSEKRKISEKALYSYAYSHEKYTKLDKHIVQPMQKLQNPINLQTVDDNKLLAITSNFEQKLDNTKKSLNILYRIFKM